MFEYQAERSVYEISHKYVGEPNAEDYSRHMHGYCEILLFVQGDAKFNIDGNLYNPKPYDLLIIPKGAYHYLIPRSPAPYENYVLDFSSTLIPQQHSRRLFSKPQIINIKENADFCRFFHLLDEYYSTYNIEDFAISAKALLRQMLIYCSYRIDKTAQIEPSHNPLVDSILQMISEQIGEPLDAEQIAKQMMLSKSHIQNVFSQEMHIGLKQYIMQKKIFAAQSDLMAGISPADVCAKYGFSDYSVFFRVYKKTLGYSPRQTKRFNS